MVNDAHAPAANGQDTPDGGVPGGLDERQFARTRLVNRGRDTQITLHDGSIIVLKGVIQLAAVFAANASAANSKPSPVGGEIGDDEEAHRRRNGGEGLGGIGK